MSATASGRWWRCVCRIALGLALVAGALGLAPTYAAEAHVAVAGNFAAPFARLALAFAAQAPHTVSGSVGSTGAFYAQIKNGAPFAVLLAADAETPAKLEREGLAVKGTRVTYARGKLVLWSARPGFVDGQGEVLRRGAFAHLAIANPALAPYGAAADATLRALGLRDLLRPKLVTGESIAQAYQFVASGNAALGFVAWSQIVPVDQPLVGSYWMVPAALYPPLVQDAILLQNGSGNPAAMAFLVFLRSPAAQAIIKTYGFDL